MLITGLGVSVNLYGQMRRRDSHKLHCALLLAKEIKANLGKEEEWSWKT